MRRTEFSEYLSEVLGEIRNRLESKGDEYADLDQFHNFIEGAKRRNISKEDYLLNLVCKHEVSVADLVSHKGCYKYDEADYTKAHEKIHDILAYYILLLAMFKENCSEELPF